jgi:hypothetical protein
MKLSMYCVGADASASGASHLKIFGNIGIQLTSGVIIEFDMTMSRQIFVISKPLEINRMNNGFRATAISMKNFEVSWPPKNITIADLNSNLADVKVVNRNSAVADVRITVCDKMNQPNYTIERYNVPYKGIMSSEFEVRGNMVLTKTYYHKSTANAPTAIPYASNVVHPQFPRIEMLPGSRIGREPRACIWMESRKG